MILTFKKSCLMKAKLLPLAGLILLAACAQEQPIAQEEATAGKMVTIRVTVPEKGDTKVAFTPESGKLALSWETTDCIRVISGSESQLFTISNIISDHEAEFTGYAVSGTSFDILCPGTYATVAEAEEDAVNPAQNGNDSADHLTYKALLSGVDSYDKVSFTSTWAGEHGGTFKQGAAIKLQANLPAGVTTLKELNLCLAGNVYTLPLTNVNVSAAGQELTAYMMLPWNNIDLPDGVDQFVFAFDDHNEVYSAVFSPTGDKTIMGGKMNSIVNLDLAIEDFVGGDGSASNPYLIANARQMVNMNDALVSDTHTYFKLVADIDMTGIDWIPGNYESPYKKGVNFNGANHTISNLSCNFSPYPSLFGVLYGECYDLNIVNAEIEPTAATLCGVVAGYFGTSGIAASAHNVHAQGTITNAYSKRGIGGFAGTIVAGCTATGCSFEGTVNSTGANTGVGGFVGTLGGTVENCWTDCTVINSGANYAGGIFGFDSTAGAIVRNCWSAGSVSGSQRIGGIAGGVINDNTKIQNCYSLSEVSAVAVIGGIVAHASKDKWTASSSEPNNVIEKCIAWNSSITVTATPTTDYSGRGSSGVIVGYTSMKNYLTDCYRKPDINFQENWLGNVPFDQENASPTSPLVTDTDGKQYNYPYHGKAAASGKTLSQVAQDLGWDAAIWDFSNDIPTLR